MDRRHRKYPSMLDAKGWRDLALNDQRTGLASEVGLGLWVEHHYHPDKRTYLIALADIVNFKSFNDTYGQSAGDRFIGIYGRAIGALCRSIHDEVVYDSEKRTKTDQRDVYARIGGDETLLCYDLNGLSGEELRNALDTITERFHSFIIQDDVTGESRKIHAVFRLVTPAHPETIEDVRAELGEQLVELKQYQKAQTVGRRALPEEIEGINKNLKELASCLPN